MADVGTGATITFGTSPFTAEILGINHNDISRESVPTSHLGTTTARTFMPGDLYDGGELELEIAFDPDGNVPYDQAVETITVTFPLPSGQSTPADYVFSGFVTGFSYGVPFEDRMTGTITVKITGAITETASA